MLYETWLIFRRQLQATLRSPVWSLVFLFEPVCLLLLFSPLLDKLMGLPGFGRNNALSTFAPGLLIMVSIVGTVYAGYYVLNDLRSGVIERLRVTDVSPVALALGLALRDVVILMLQAAIVIGIALLMGLQANLLGTLVVLVLMALLGVMLASCSYAFSLTAKDESAMSSMVSFITMPLLLLSGVTLPLALAPDWLQTVAKVNPFYHAVEASRSLVNGDFGATNIWIAFAIVAVCTLLAVRWCAKAFSKATN